MSVVLVTGAAGYIGSHTCVELLGAGHEVISVDNYCNSRPEVISYVEHLTGKQITAYDCDLRNELALTKIFKKHQIDVVMHFAGLKSVGESCKLPLLYFDNNIHGSLVLFRAMSRFAVKNIVFSSSATVYGNTSSPPCNESMPTGSVSNPYGRTKCIIEDILFDMHRADNSLSISLLRYFNPIGAHHSGLIGEHPCGIPNNLMPYLAMVACGQIDHLTVFGCDYPTPDGTCIRDYIHVCDLARGHILALQKNLSYTGVEVYNLGTGKGVSVLEIIAAFEKTTGQKVPYIIGNRRPADLPCVYADTSKANRELSFSADLSLEKMCEDSWRFKTMNP